MSNQCPPDNAPYPSDCQILEAYRSRSQEHSRSRDTAEMRLLIAKAEPIRLLLLDVDGVLTDGSLVYSESGKESKAFCTQDGLGIRLVQKIGVEVGIITARRSDIVARRGRELGVKYIYQGIDSKLESYKDIIRQTGVKPFQVCYMGDDWIDLSLLTRVGLAACPVNSVIEVKKVCHFISGRNGGFGAVREVCDLLVLAKGAHDRLLQEYMG